MELDLGNFQSIREFVDKLKKEEKKMDVVLFNAGVRPVEYKESVEGFEEDLQIHALSTGLLGLLILPWLKAVGGGKAHMGFVTSGTMRGMYLFTSSQRGNKTLFRLSQKQKPRLFGRETCGPILVT